MLFKRKPKKKAPVSVVIVDDKHSNEDELSAYKKTLNFPATLAFENEINLFSKMKVKPKLVKKIIIKRILMTFVIIILGVGVSTMFKGNTSRLVAMASPFLGIGFWYLDSQRTKSAYHKFVFQRQLSFTKFCRLLIPYLSEMKTGVSLYSIFERISPRLDNETDKASLRKLMIDMTNNPTSDKPFLEFAKAFSVTERADLFMIQIYQMNQGAFDDKNIQDLGAEASKDLMKQIHTIVNMKLKRFKNLSTWLTMCAAIMLLGYFGTLIISTFQQAFNMK